MLWDFSELQTLPYNKLVALHGEMEQIDSGITNFHLPIKRLKCNIWHACHYVYEKYF